MAAPTPTSPLNNPSHSTLHNFHANVKAFGAVGDGVTDDTSAIQTCIDANDALGSHEIFFPSGAYKISSPLEIIGDGVNFSVSLVGPQHGPTSTSPAAYLKPATQDMNAINVSSAESQSHFFSMRNLGIVYTSAGTATGVGLNLAATANQLSSVIIEGVLFSGAGTGVAMGAHVDVIFRDCQFIVCDSYGVDSPGGNLLQFENCNFGSCSVGIRFSGINRNTRFESCIFQSNTLSDVKIASGNLTNFSFNTCWFEFPPSIAQIDIEGSQAGWSLKNGAFNQCLFQHDDTPIFYISKTAPNTAEYVNRIGFYNCEHVGAGSITSAATGEPNNDGFGFGDLTVLGGFMDGTYQGITPPAMTPNQMSVFQGVSSTSINPVVGALGRPRFLALQGQESIHLRTDLGAIEMSEVSDPAAAATGTGYLYMKDNGEGKTQLVARFPTGVVQVIATEP